MTIEPMTLLQRGVIQRLREAGFQQLADASRHEWTHGRPVPWPPPSDSNPPTGELGADFERANEQARGV